MKTPAYLASAMLFFAFPIITHAFDQSSPVDSLVVDSLGNVGIGTATPTAAVQVLRTSTTTIPDMYELTNSGDVRFRLTDTVAAGFWRMSVENAANQFVITRSGTGAPEFKLTNLGDLSIRGGLIANYLSSQNTFPDYVFEEDYPLMKIDQLKKYIAKNKHLPNIPSAKEVQSKGGQMNMTQMQLKLLEKIEELTLYTIEQQQLINKQQEQLNQQSKKIVANSDLKGRITSLEKLITSIASNQGSMSRDSIKLSLNK